MPIQRTLANEQNQPKQRSRSADRSNRKAKNNRSSISVPKYIRQAIELPEVKVVTENLSSKQISDAMQKLERQGAIRKLKVESLNCRFNKSIYWSTNILFDTNILTFVFVSGSTECYFRCHSTIRQKRSVKHRWNGWSRHSKPSS